MYWCIRTTFISSHLRLSVLKGQRQEPISSQRPSTSTDKATQRNHWHASVSRPHRILHWLVNLQHILVQEQDRTKSLRFGARGHPAIHRKVGQKGFDLWSAHFFWTTFPVEENKALRPLVVGLLGAIDIVLGAQSMTQTIKQLGGLLGAVVRQVPVV